MHSMMIQDNWYPVVSCPDNDDDHDDYLDRLHQNNYKQSFIQSSQKGINRMIAIRIKNNWLTCKDKDCKISNSFKFSGVWTPD